MKPERWTQAAIIFTLVTGVVLFWPHEGRWPEGPVAEDEPEQGKTLSPEEAPQWQEKNFTIRGVAPYQIKARVLSVKSYDNDPLAPIVPLDFALAWGPMSDSKVLEQLTISQRGRWYFYRWEKGNPPIPPIDIMTSSANVHMIPASPLIKEALKKVQRGDVVYLNGWLVNITFPNGQRADTSLTRKDIGAGSCEIMRVETITLEKPPL